MNLEGLKKKISKYGTLEVIKEGYVFTVLMTGSDFTKWNVVSEIQGAVIEYVGAKYPIIEVLKNEEDFFCLILRPENKKDVS